MKKWWVIALVFVLALSLTSCSRKRDPQNTLGFGYCDGTMGQIDVYVRALAGDPGRWELILNPFTVTEPGDLVTVTVVQQQSLQYKIMLNEVVINPGIQISAGILTTAELDLYDVLAVTSYQGGTTFLQANPEKSAVCTLPYPGDQLVN